MGDCSEDYLIALRLEAEFALEDANADVASLIPPQFRKGSPLTKRNSSPVSPKPSTSKGLSGGGPATAAGLSIIAPEWEDLDPTPDLQAMFLQYNDKFFWGKLAACEVRWSPRMTVCAGLCSYSPRQGYCSIRLSVPLLKLRPRKDFVETLLHEMIHAYLFVTDGNDDHDGHGPAFHSHMYRINKATGTNISVYHSFHDEVALYKQHWWKCNGPCVSRKPFYGLVKRSMNRAPGPNDLWWKDHATKCGGAFVKIKEPEGYSHKKTKAAAAGSSGNGSGRKATTVKGQRDIRSLFDKTNQIPKGSAAAGGSMTPVKGSTGGGRAFKSPVKSSKTPVNSHQGSPKKTGGGRGNIFGFGGTSFGSPGGGSSSGGVQTKGKTGSFVVNPGWKVKDNSSSGHVLNGSASKGQNKDNSASGHVLNGSTSKDRHNIKKPAPSLDSSSEQVRASVRDIWSKKFDSQQSQSASFVDSQPGPQSASCVDLTSPEQINSSRCPVCQKKVPESIINRHLDECLNVTALSQEEQVSRVEEHKTKTTAQNPTGQKKD